MNVSHGKDKGLVNHNKNHMGHLIWKKMYFMNVWKNARGGTCSWCKKIKVMDLNKKQQRKGKISFLLWSLSFLVGSSLIIKLTLCNTPFLKTWSYTLQKVAIHCPLFENPCLKCKVLRQRSHVVLTSVGDKCATKHWGENQGEICSTLTCFLHYMHIFQSLDVSWWTWHLCYGCWFY
jgi:hypothetical protein